jgi:hypothetical protein
MNSSVPRTWRGYSYPPEYCAACTIPTRRASEESPEPIYGANLAPMAPILDRIGGVYNHIYSNELWLGFLPTAPRRQDATIWATPLKPPRLPRFRPGPSYAPGLLAEPPSWGAVSPAPHQTSAHLFLCHDADSSAVRWSMSQRCAGGGCSASGDGQAQAGVTYGT